MHSEDHLNEFEQRISAWRPTTEGLESDAMLYQAGLTAGRNTRGRSFWPSLCLALATACAGLGAWGLVERAEHQALIREGEASTELLKRQMIAKRNMPHDAETVSVSYVPAHNDYFQLRRQAEQDLGRWLASVQTIGVHPIKQPSSPDILRAGELDRFRDQ